ncbi:hypothetical protein TNCV_2815391 [Trichonephila clavipes]|nr:hypothetical protein TNCV_2815391 [Trichonephila clavipes]
MRTEKGFLYNQEHGDADIEHVLTPEAWLNIVIEQFIIKFPMLKMQTPQLIIHIWTTQAFYNRLCYSEFFSTVGYLEKKRTLNPQFEVTRDTTARIIRHENLELAKKLSNALDTGCAYVQGKRTFASSFKQSPKLFVVNTPNENTVKMAQWIREFTVDLELQRKRNIESLRRYICSISPNMLQPRTDDAETAGENDAGVVSNGGIMEEVNHGEVMQGYEENVMQDYEENVMQDYEENVMQDYEENVKQEVNHGETAMEKAGVNNGRIDVGENYETTKATAKNQNYGGESLFQMMTESAFKSYFNNKHDSSEIFTQIPHTIHFTRTLNSRIMIVVPDA